MTSIGEHSLGLDAQAFRATDSAASRDGHSGAGCRRLKGQKGKVDKVRKVLLILLGTQQSRHDKTHEHKRVLKFGWWNVLLKEVL